MPPLPLHNRPSWRAHALSEAHCDIEGTTVERVWQLLCDVERWPHWNPAVTQARAERELAPGARFFWRSGGMSIVSTIEHWLPARQLVWSGRAFGTNAWHAWELEPHANGVRVRTAESFGGWLPRLMPGAMAAMLDRALPAWLAHLARAAQHADHAVHAARSAAPDRRHCG